MVLVGVCCASAAGWAQQEGPVPTEALVKVESKNGAAPAAREITIKVDGKTSPLTAWRPAQSMNGGGVQVALLLDEGLRTSVGRQIEDLRNFVAGMPPEMQVFIGYMSHGSVVPVQEFTTDHAAAANKVRLPSGLPGMSGSPYFCLSTFAQQWPSSQPAARFVLMITNGVDPYNGSVSPMNQNSPYVERAQKDAQRAGIAVYSIYYADSGRVMRTEAASFSGQNYLVQLAEATGGRAYSEGEYSPVAMAPYLKQFQTAISETYVASFMANAGRNKLMPVKFSTSANKTKLNGPYFVLPGNREGPQP